MTRRNSTPGLTAALAAIAILLTACSDDPGIPDAGGEGSTTSSPTESSPTQPPPSPIGWTPLPEDGGDEILPAGRYGLKPSHLPDLPWAVVETPGGFSNFAGGALLRDDTEGGGGVGYWTVHAVYSDPCETDVVEVDTVEEAAVAFRSQQRSRVSAPSPVTLYGYQGLYLKLQVPQDVDFAECGRNYMLWDVDSHGGGRYFEGPGQADRLWILDVEGNVVIVNAIDDPDLPKPAREQLTDMVESVAFIRWPNPRH